MLVMGVALIPMVALEVVLLKNLFCRQPFPYDETLVLGCVGAVFFLVGAAMSFPLFAIEIRRLHDVGKSGWWDLLWLVPVFGWIKLTGILLRPGEKETNSYGPPPAE